MDDKKVKERREHIRTGLLTEYAHVNGSPNVCRDISLGGVFIFNRTLDYKIKEHVEVEIELPGSLGHLLLSGIVVQCAWNGNNKGYGIKFITKDKKTLDILGSYIVYIRNKQIINVSKRIIEEFFNPKFPTI